jgi:uncharacterized membrane protein SpoIIM required for sporulation
MLNQQSFEQRYEADWQALRETLAAMRSRRPGNRPDASQYDRFPELYARACQHLSLAKTRGYSPQLVESLNNLVLESYNQLYRYRGNRLQQCFEFVLRGFPQLVRQHAALFWVASALFYLPAIIVGLACYFDADFIYRIHDPSQVSSYNYMYDPSSDANYRSEERHSASDFQMFGFYIKNNIGIDFRIFASGILFGIGTVFFLIYNGLAIGSVAGYLTGEGYISTFWGFVAGHSAFELTAACISGMAGLLLGLALIRPGNRTRKDALKLNALIAVKLVAGAGTMTLAAAFIEAFWSSMHLAPLIKYSVGIVFWVLTAAYLLLAGRQ